MKQIKIRIIICIFITGLFSINSLAQSKTPYEKRKAELTLQLLKQLGVSQNQINRANDMGNIEGLFMLSGIVNKLNTMEGLVLLERYQSDLKKAERLKNAVDLKKDREKKDREKKEKEREIALEKIKAQENEIKLSAEKYNNTDFAKISRNIKSAYEQWLVKSEFEKLEAYQKRIKENYKRSFDSICNSNILEAISNTLETNHEYVLEVGQYDAEKEFFRVKINLFNTTVEDTINVNISDAEWFKNGSGSRNIIEIQESTYDWCFNNNQLNPYKINITIGSNQYSKDISKSLTKIKRIVFNTKELNIKNENFEELNFDFIKYNENLKFLNTVHDYEAVEIKPEFIEGNNKLNDYVTNNIHRPRYVNDFGNTVDDYPKGKVTVSFIVEKDGALSDYKIIEDVGMSSGDELIKVLKSAPRWKPGEQNGNKVRIQNKFSIELRKFNAKDYYSLPYREAINFPLPKNECKEKGSIALGITVNGSGKVISTSLLGDVKVSRCLLEEAKINALNTVFDNTYEKLKTDKNMNEQERNYRSRYSSRQEGIIYYNFEN